MEMFKECTVFVVDGDSAARESVITLAEKKGLRAEGFASAEEFLAQYDPAKKGCIVIDAQLAGLAGSQFLKQLKITKGSLPVVIVADLADVQLVVRAMKAGALTFLEKPCPEQELWQAIRQALETEQSQHDQRIGRADAEARLATLSEDELEVFRRLLAGHANKRIAADLDIGLRTVELRRSNIMKKMQATSLPDLVRLAILVNLFKLEAAG